VELVFVPLEAIGVDVSIPWIITEMPAHFFNNPVPLKMHGHPSPEYKIPRQLVFTPVPLKIRGPPSHEYKIPRQLIFTHKQNLLETKNPPLLYENVQKTIQTYRDAWGEPKAPVWFLNDTDCRSAIYAA
jgi:hypothetical protein